MKVKVIPISHAKMVLGDLDTVELPDNSSVEGLLTTIGLSKKSPFVYSVNNKIASYDTILLNGDIIHLIPIVSGG
jgi:sulfur carrier protein ThiS